jgi:hypothetical protein
MQVLNHFTSELNHFVDSCNGFNLSAKSLGKVGLAAARVAAFMATAGFAILSLSSLFSGNSAGFFSSALFALGAHEAYRVIVNFENDRCKNLFRNTILLDPISNFIDKIVYQK